jgi:hypothetical protein
VNLRSARFQLLGVAVTATVAGAAGAVGLYVTHRQSVVFSAHYSGYSTSPTAVTLDPGSYHARSVLAGCFGTGYLAPASKSGLAGDVVHLWSPALQFTLDSTSPYEKDFAIPKREAFAVVGAHDVAQTNSGCVIDMTITRK